MHGAVTKVEDRGAEVDVATARVVASKMLGSHRHLHQSVRSSRRRPRVPHRPVEVVKDGVRGRGWGRGGRGCDGACEELEEEAKSAALARRGERGQGRGG
ncbi:hypothetical protein E2562_020330 [Oryza meyeriana var. granulata]|uniref:Uncharacterized protein n=1 Tax=Oryza meyeriana var. granulata TaxID=110450 RepID=A0A6G1EAU3_9ORYZ|nr:hypothetical protein E2562_020330 [Oryza meyeriana var. granulata]